jgi:hypothetical protein
MKSSYGRTVAVYRSVADELAKDADLAPWVTGS